MVTGRRPRLCHVGTASGDPRWFNARVSEAGQVAGVEVYHLNRSDRNYACRPMVHAAVASGELPLTYCTDDGAGLLYRGTTMVEAVAEQGLANCYRVLRQGDSATVVEDVLDISRL